MIWAQLDIWIVAVYILLMLGIGFWHRRFANKSMDNFFLGGRKIPGWLNGISYTSALVSPDAATGYGGLAVATGGFICWWYLSRFGLALFLGGVLFAFFWRRLNLFTSLEFYDLRFPKRAASAMRLWIAIRTSLIAMPAWTGITLLAACKIMGPAFDLSKTQTLLLVVPISLLFVFSSGYKGVVISNFIQMIIFFAGTLMLAYLTLKHFGGATAMVQAITGKFGPVSTEILGSVPPEKHAIFPLAAAFGWLFGQSIGYGGDAAPMGGAMEGQRILSTRTPAEALTMYVVAAISMFLLLLLVTLPSISAAVMWPELREVGADRELVYGKLMKALLPAGAMGLMIAAMLAATMSTVGDNLNFGSQVLVSDIYKRWFVPNAKEGHYLRMGKLGMIVILVLSVAVVFNVLIITDVAIFMLSLSAAELPANWAQWWWWRFNGPARVAASFGGAAIFCLVVVGPKLLVLGGVSGASVLIIPWYWQTLLVMGITTLLWVVVALVTKPDPEQLLSDFYVRARPLGFWGPFRKLAAAEVKGSAGPVLTGLLIAVLGASAVALFILGFTHAWFARYLTSVIVLAIAALVFIAFWKMAQRYLRYLELRQDDQPADKEAPEITISIKKLNS
jgi:SSS family solute:Na+ symporter